MTNILIVIPRIISKYIVFNKLKDGLIGSSFFLIFYIKPHIFHREVVRLTQKIVDYVMTTPCNTNSAVLRSLLSGMSAGGGSTGSLVSLTVGTTTTTDPGTDANVVNSGTAQDAVLDFYIPRGDVGPSPEIGENNNWYINGVDSGKPAFGVDEEARAQIEELEMQFGLASTDDIDNIFD